MAAGHYFEHHHVFDFAFIKDDKGVFSSDF